MSKICVLIPGIGYTLQKPLLYWSERLFKQRGYEIAKVEFSAFGKNAKEKIDESVEIACEECKKALKGLDFDGAEEIVFVSKSVGTCAALRFQEENSIFCKNILFTPIEQSFLEAKKLAEKALLGKCLVFHGSADPWIKSERLLKDCKDFGMSVKITQGANHSLETGDALFDAQNIALVLKACADFI